MGDPFHHTQCGLVRCISCLKESVKTCDCCSNKVCTYCFHCLRKTIKEITIKDEDERKEINTLDLSKNTIQGQGFNIVVKELIPLLPCLEIIDLSYNLIGEKGLESLYELLATYSHLKYVNIYGNGVARLVKKKVSEMEEASLLRKQIIDKVIVTPKSLVIETFSSSTSLLQHWGETHKLFYQLKD